MRRTARPPFYLNLWYDGSSAMRRAVPSNTVVRARGMRLTFADGSTLDDWCGQYYVNSLGAGRAEVARDMAAMARRMSWVSPSLYAGVRLDLTRDLLSVLPRRLTTPQFTIGGSDAIESAIRAAREVTGRTRVLSLTRSYHGDTITVESVCGETPTPYADLRPWAIKTPCAYDFWEAAGRDWERAGTMALERARATLERRGPRSFAAVIVEPVMWTTGAVPVSRALARGLRALCDRYGIKLIADEVVTGFGRTGRWFGCQAVGIVPDAVVCAKGLTGGYAPLGAVVFERSWGERLRRDGFNHGLTFGGHPVGCAAARATIRILKRERLVERAATMGRRLRRGLMSLRSAHPEKVADVRGSGLLLGLQLEAGYGPSAAERAGQIAEAALAAGQHLLTVADGSTLLFCPPFTITHRQIDDFLKVLDRALARA